MGGVFSGMATDSGREYIELMLFTRLLGTSPGRHDGLPSLCVVCHAWPARRICDACVSRFAAPTARCTGCARRVPQGVQRCGDCLRHPPALDTCIAAVDYAYPWADLLVRFKFASDTGTARALAALLHRTTGVSELLAQADALLPIPLAPGRLRARGYNQSLLLARALEGPPPRPRWLQRTRETTPQSSLHRGERLRNLQGVFKVSDTARHELPNLDLVLVDDVMTTGATLHAAATALREAGARHVSALVVARTP